jgi:hypothetical protein
VVDADFTDDVDRLVRSDRLVCDCYWLDGHFDSPCGFCGVGLGFLDDEQAACPDRSR